MTETKTLRVYHLGWWLSRAIRLYQVALSPFLGKNCRYHPTCSAYALESLELHGSMRGSWLALRRLGRCHPWRAGGYDPVPRPNARSVM